MQLPLALKHSARRHRRVVSQDHWDLHREFNPMHPDCNKSQALELHVHRGYNNASPPCPIKPEWNWHRCAQREAGNSNLTKAGGGPTSNMNVKSREIFLCLKIVVKPYLSIPGELTLGRCSAVDVSMRLPNTEEARCLKEGSERSSTSLFVGGGPRD